MEAYDDNEDGFTFFFCFVILSYNYSPLNLGRISASELAQILPVEENFLFLIRQEKILGSASDFLKVWSSIDSDNSGYIEANELSNFITKCLQSRIDKGNQISDEKIEDYTDALVKRLRLNNIWERYEHLKI